ncbi:hypothetical protein HK098_000873 [Nowakowskiella sp. JEL0407]|nr:hypothetical protein HK098_000873 [Nowakowskiella sp. JEL0407]
MTSNSWFAVLFLLGIATGLLFQPHLLSRSPSYSTNNIEITSDAFLDGVQKCSQITKHLPLPPPGNPRWKIPSEISKTNHTISSSPQFSIQSSSSSSNFATPNLKLPAALLITNATLLDQNHYFVSEKDILIVKGSIHDIGVFNIAEVMRTVAELGFDLEIFDVKGHIVTPGIIDMHSHMGVDSWPELFGTDDTNEGTHPTTPQLRSIDGFNVQDNAIKIINSGGVTTSLILPGSANLMGGEAYAVKLRVPLSNSVDEMLLNYGLNKTESKVWRWMKMACGENPKRFYGKRRGIMPDSRLGEGWLLRERYQAAVKYNQKQDDWCAKAQSLQKRRVRYPHLFLTERFPEDLELESLAALLRGDVLLQNHCYEPTDMEMQIRNSKEFNFTISAFHHAVEAWMIPQILKRENIGVAMFADLWAYKKEAYEPSVKSGKILHEAGVPVAYKSDHPVLNAQHLVYEAAKAHHYGLPFLPAVESVTATPAKLIGQAHRIGLIAKDYDADLVVWSKNPLELGAHPLRVFIDGLQTYKNGKKKIIKIEEEGVEEYVKNREERNSREVVLSSYCVKGGKKMVYDEKNVIDGGRGIVCVEGGIIKCLGKIGECEEKGEIFDLKDGYLVPGAVVADSNLGLVEIESEKSTHDGSSEGYELKSGGFRAIDGLRVGKSSKVLKSLFNAGVTSAFTVPQGDGLVIGQAGLFYTGSENINTATIKEVTHLRLAIGDSAKASGPLKSISGQIATLRSLLLSELKKNGTEASSQENDDFADDGSERPFRKALFGELVLAIRVEKSDDILKIVKLKKEVEEIAIKKYQLSVNLKIVIVGGAEAWMVAKELSESSIAVHLKPARCTPSTFESLQCLTPSSTSSAVEYLLHHKVSLSVQATEEDSNNRNLFWEAGWIRSDTFYEDNLLGRVVGEVEAIGFVTWNVANKLLGESEAKRLGIGRIVVGTKASFVGFSGSPLVFGPVVKFVVNGEKVVLDPEQD